MTRTGGSGTEPLLSSPLKDLTQPSNMVLVVEYAGEGMLGWQKQSEKPTVQGLLEEAFRNLGAKGVSLLASGRTDSGVHARTLLARARTAVLNVPVEKLPKALSAHLPGGVAVVAAFPASADFHPIRDSLRKTYRYTLLERPVRPALETRVWHVGGPLDVAAMRRGARYLRGRHDFSAFATDAAEKKDTERTVFSIRISRNEDLVFIDVEGDGFLYNMVRAIAGSLVEIGRGRYGPEWIMEVLEGRDRSRGGPTAPARGLTLMRVIPDVRMLRSDDGGHSG